MRRGEMCCRSWVGSIATVIAESVNRGFNVDVLTEPLIALRERTIAAETALIEAFGPERTEELFSTFQEAPIEREVG